MENFMVDEFMVEKYGVEKSRFETPPKSPGPVRIKDSGVEMSCNLHKPGRKRSRIDLCP
jgi:hypothetical protein